MHFLNIIISSIYIAVWVWILYYITKLEITGCKCSADWRRTFIKYYIIVLLIMFVLRIFEYWSPQETAPALMTIQFMFSIMFMIVVFNYINDLKVKKCRCSENDARDLLEILNYVNIFLMALSLLIIVHFMFVLSHLASNNKQLVSMLKKLKVKK